MSKIANLRTANVQIAYSASDGFSSKVGYGARGADPKAVMLEAIDELGRLSELFGFGDEALDKLNFAQGRVRVWKAENPEACKAE